MTRIPIRTGYTGFLAKRVRKEGARHVFPGQTEEPFLGSTRILLRKALSGEFDLLFTRKFTQSLPPSLENALRTDAYGRRLSRL